jgi:crotonobetainyl-CoA:carnitine CoA-transferase CaiB-like acyl-CoA transferase
MTTRPFEGIRIIDITHVLAGPFAAYQLAVLGADFLHFGLQSGGDLLGRFVGDDRDPFVWLQAEALADCVASARN